MVQGSGFKRNSIRSNLGWYKDGRDGRDGRDGMDGMDTKDCKEDGLFTPWLCGKQTIFRLQSGGNERELNCTGK